MSKWAMRPLGEVMQIDRKVGSYDGLPYVGMEDIESNTGRLTCDLSSKRVKSQTFQFGPQHVLYGRLRPYLNKYATPNFVGHCSTEIFPLLASEKLDRHFLAYWLSLTSTCEAINETCRGARMPRANMEEVLFFQIPLPPLDEQKRIVAKLDEVNAGVEKALQKYVTEIACYEILWRKELKSLMMAGDQRRPRVRIGDVCVLKSGKTVSKEIERSHGEIPYLKVADMNLIENANKIVTSSRFLMSEDVKPSQIMPAGTTIFPKRGGAIATNKKRITSVPICVDLNVMGVIPGPLVSPKMLYYFFAGIDMRDLGDGSSIPQINNPDIAPLEMMLPNSISEQDSITKRLDVIQSKINALSGLVTKKRVQLEVLGIAVGEEAFRRGT